MPRALLTGGTGLVGHFIARRLLDDGWSVTHLSRRAPPGARHLAWDLDTPPPDLPASDALIHCAFAHVPGRYRGGEGDDPAGFVRRNRDATVALFEAARHAGVPAAVFLSSRAVYGDHPPGTILTEEMPPRPDTLYGQVKLEAEKAIAALARPGFRPVSLRATGVYGPAPPGRAHKWMALFESFLAGQPVAPRAGTEVHGDDLAAAVLGVLRAGDAPLYNVSDLVLDRHDLLGRVARLAGSDRIPPPRAGLPVSAMDCSRLRGLGWRPGGLDRLEATLPVLLHP